MSPADIAAIAVVLAAMIVAGSVDLKLAAGGCLAAVGLGVVAFFVKDGVKKVVQLVQTMLELMETMQQDPHLARLLLYHCNILVLYYYIVI